MSGDTIIWITVVISFLVINITGLVVYQFDKLPLLVYGIIVVVLAPVCAVCLGYVFAMIETGGLADGVGFGAGLAAVIIGFGIMGNGIIYVIWGMILSVRKALKKRKEEE